MIVSDRIRAPCKNFSLINPYYKKKLQLDETKKKTHKENERTHKRLKVIEFFLKDENSRPAPGIYEVITRKKKKMRKRYLADTVQNLYAKFCEENGPIVLRRTQFYSLKPFWVVCLKVTERDTTACKEHENFQSIFDKLRYHKVIAEPNLKAYIATAVCSYKNHNCMYGPDYEGEPFTTWYNY